MLVAQGYKASRRSRSSSGVGLGSGMAAGVSGGMGTETADAAHRRASARRRPVRAPLRSALRDPLTFTQIFPYINQLLSALHLVDDPAKVGFYSGLVESTFAFFQLCSIYQWARLSDNVGRRPVILATTFGLALATFLFGFASSLPVILLSRAIAGICSGNAAVLHSVLAVAFSTYGLFWPLGSIIGPILGGALADPAAYYVHVRIFQNQFFRDHPYFLPSFATGLLAFVIGCLALGLLREVHPSSQTLSALNDRGCRRTGPIPTSTPHPHPHHPNVQPVSLGGLLRHPVLRRLALSGALLCFTATAFDALFVLFCYTPVQLGGLSFTSHQIATSLALAGTSSIILQATVLPPLLRRVSHARLYTFCMLAWPITYAVVPLLNLIHKPCPRQTKCALPRRTRKANGIVLWAMCLARAGAPAFVSSFFAWSTTHRVLGGHLWLVVMLAFALAGCAVSRGIEARCAVGRGGSACRRRSWRWSWMGQRGRSR
ncbi:major facilitator superfamily domain-containing protein [Pholiota molesta]|nr:major facilitator superfamily domain-containing protein [Pholiota molesta]